MSRPKNATGPPTSPSAASSWRARSRVAACSGVAFASIFARAVSSAPSRSHCAEQRQHVVLEDLLALPVAQERRLIARPREQLDLAVARVAAMEVVEDDQPVVEALAADAPLVHERRARPPRPPRS